MALLKLKKSSVAGKVPLTTDLAYGELALNYADGKLFFKSSTDTIVSFNATGTTSPVVPISLTAPANPSSGNLWWDNQAGKLKIYYDDTTSAQWVDAFYGSGISTGGGGGSSVSFTSGTATIDFGVSPGSNEANIAITGQTSITADSIVFVSVRSDSTSLDHSANDHAYFTTLASLTTNTPTAGTGFTISARSQQKLTGKWTIHWSWI